LRERYLFDAREYSDPSKPDIELEQGPFDDGLDRRGVAVAQWNSGQVTLLCLQDLKGLLLGGPAVQLTLQRWGSTPETLTLTRRALVAAAAQVFMRLHRPCLHFPRRLLGAAYASQQIREAVMKDLLSTETCCLDAFSRDIRAKALLSTESSPLQYLCGTTTQALLQGVCRSSRLGIFEVEVAHAENRKAAEASASKGAAKGMPLLSSEYILTTARRHHSLRTGTGLRQVRGRGLGRTVRTGKKARSMALGRMVRQQGNIKVIKWKRRTGFHVWRSKFMSSGVLGAGSFAVRPKVGRDESAIAVRWAAVPANDKAIFSAMAKLENSMTMTQPPSARVIPGLAHSASQDPPQACCRRAF
jgi:hypothetical protein